MDESNVEDGDLLGSEPHPQEVVVERDGRRVVTMDSARYVDAGNTGTDVVVAASYIGVLPARLMAPHRPRAVIGHDGGIGKDAAGIQGLYYLEALGIPAVAADGESAELGNGEDLYREGVVSRLNILAAVTHLIIANALAALLVILMQRNFLGRGNRRMQADGEGDQRQANVTFPVSARCHGITLQ